MITINDALVAAKKENPNVTFDKCLETADKYIFIPKQDKNKIIWGFTGVPISKVTGKWVAFNPAIHNKDMTDLRNAKVVTL